MSRHVLTIAEMTKHLASRDDIKPDVKAKVLAGESCIGLPGKDFYPLLAVPAYAKQRWAEGETKVGVPGAVPAIVERSTDGPAPAARAHAPAAASKAPLYELELDDGREVKLTAEQIRNLVSAGKAHGVSGVRVVGQTKIKFLREFPELMPVTKVAAQHSAPALTPEPTPRAPAVAGSSILRNFHRGQRAELDANEPELSPFRRLVSSPVVPESSKPDAAPQETRALPPSRIAARAQQLALEAHRAPAPDPGPEAA
jgi:hypothetical protein